MPQCKCQPQIAQYTVQINKQVFNFPVAWVKSVVEPDRVTDDALWESVALIGIHPEIVFQEQLTWLYRLRSQIPQCAVSVLQTERYLATD